MGRRILPSARKHGIDDDQIHHALDHALVVERYEDRLLYLGPDRASNLLEVVTIMELTEELVIHAMPVRAKYLPLLRGLGDDDA
ncbi:hypothetical protein [Aquihabitans sp. McL0605]|uniref:hypothetical protein n=1 Tax=Aquihabitans sp. McL0605 TaxID=3415671 RepID=UPI003CF51716